MTSLKTSSIVRNLQITFSISIILLIFSLVSSFLSVQELIQNSKLVNHTHEVIIEAEKVISYMKDGETGQRGYLVTRDTLFLQPYYGSREKALQSYARVKALTADNPVQQERTEKIRQLIENKFRQMRNVITISARSRQTGAIDTIARYNEMFSGKQIMDSLRTIVRDVKKTETELLEKRTADQEAYISYSRVLVILAALISVLISGFSYFRIKKDLDERIARQKEDERLYAETARRILQMESVTGAIAQGNYTTRSHDLADDELGRIGKALNNMGEHLQANFDELTRRAWLQEGDVLIGDSVRGERNVENLSSRLLECLTGYLEAPVATMYVTGKNSTFKLTAAHALRNAQPFLHIGEGVTGQAVKAKEMKVITDLPGDYFAISSSTGTTSAVSVIILPLIYEDEAIGAIEIGMLRQPLDQELELLDSTMEKISIAVNAALDHQKLQELLEETQAQSEELQVQHSELENLNSELETQAQSLQASEEELKVQQEELQQTNAELEERTLLLEEKNNEIRRKAEELALTTRYKSEFLANMSHELRTPLNSILLLSRLLSDNQDSNLNEDQVEYARVIQSSGNGLLWLIDEILDLSKIEAGKMDLDFERVNVAEVTRDLKAMFKPLAAEKQIDLELDIDSSVQEQIETDRMRLEQVLKNLLSNAIKFTAEGSVTLAVKRCTEDDRFVCFSVKDTGIGIPQDKQHLVFQAFQQADGSTKRKYGGTGLGLSISKELVRLLGGEIHLFSKPGEGSEFIVRIPAERLPENETAALPPLPQLETLVPEQAKPYISLHIPEDIADDRDTVNPGDNTILIVEDDVAFAQSVLEFTRKRGYKGIVCVRGDEAPGLALRYKPAGILLDVELPVSSGWEVMEALKGQPETRSIPVHMMSAHKMRQHGIRTGAIDFIEKPVSMEQMQDVFAKIEHVLAKNPKKVLIVEDNTKHAEALAFFLGGHEITSEIKNNVEASISALRNEAADCIILDMAIPANNAYDVLEQIKQNEGMENLPIIIFTGKSLSVAEEQRIRKYADSIVVKTAHSYQRMLDEVSLFLHLVEEKKNGPAAEKESKTLGMLHEVLTDRTVLIADDDIRNIFSLTKALEGLRMNVITSTDGKEALKKLEEHPEIDVVLLDMMMPEMDGYETARRIRENPAYKELPVIAVTAKAMTGDREKCITAGASDYITKPVDIDQLLSLLRVWLYDK